MQQNNIMKFSRDRKNNIDFQLDVLEEGGRVEGVFWKCGMDVLHESIDL